MIVPQTSLPNLPFTEQWRIVHRANGWDRGYTETAITGSRVLFVEETGRDRGAYGCLDAASGRRLWSVPTALETTHMLRATPRYGVVSGERRLLVFDPKDGRRVWVGMRAGFGAGPLVVGDRLFAEMKPNVLTAIDLRTRRIAWRRPFPARVQTKTGFNRMTVIGDSLWVPDARGGLTRVAQSDGHVVWSRPFTGGEVASLVPMGSRVAVCGTNATEAWRPSDGARQWRVAVGDYTAGFYRPVEDQLWKIAYEGRLRRIDARTGRLLGDEPTLERRGGAFEPVGYRGGLLAYDGERLILIDARGKARSAFSPEESLYDLDVLGEGLLIRSDNGIVRLRLGAAPQPHDPAVTAARLVAKTDLTPADRRTILALGLAALPALFAATPEATGSRAETLLGTLGKTADRQDTGRMLDLAERRGVFSRFGRDVAILYDWLMDKGNPEPMGMRLLPRLKAARLDEGDAALLTLELRSAAPLVVDELLARLQAPKTPKEAKAILYGGIAACGRADVLDEILRLRSQGLRLTESNHNLTLRGDQDGDGVPDDLDANPLVASGPLNETQRVLFALFDARFRFDSRNDVIGILDYGKAIAPFELTGWRGGLVPADLTGKLFKAGAYAKPRELSASIVLGPVSLNANGTEATATASVHYGPLDGTGFEARLHKSKGEWFVVSLRMTWIS